MSFGVTSQGFRGKRIEDIKIETEASLRGDLGEGINLDAKSPLGQINGVLAEREAKAWEALEDTYDSAYPDTAEGVQVDKVLSITGNKRKGATMSLIDLGRAFGTPATAIPADTVISVAGNPTARFLVDAPFVIDQPAVDEVQKITFSGIPTAGAWSLRFDGEDTVSLAFNASSATVQTELRNLPNLADIVVTGNYTIGFTLTYTGADGGKDQPLIQEASNTLVAGVTPVTLTRVVLVAGTVPFGNCKLTAEDDGAIQAPAGSLTVIETPVAGLDSFTNLEDAIVGREVERDDEAKIRREEELQLAGAATSEAIRSELLALEGVTACIVFQNRASIPIVDGLIIRPPHSVDIVVEGGDEDEIASEIFRVVGAGITMIGSVLKNVTDSQGFVQEVRFSRPTLVSIWLEVDLSVDTDIFPLNGDVLAAANFLAFGKTQQIGKDVIVFPKLVGALNDDPDVGLEEVPGITDVVIRIGKTNTPTLDNNVTMEPREIADFDSSRILVTVL